MSKKAIGITVACICAAGAIGIGSGIAWKEYNHYEPLSITMELGSKLSEKPEEYVKANEKLLADTKLDLSAVDTMKVGTYTVKAETADGKHSVDVKVKVEDTTAPEVALKGTEFEVIVGQELNGESIIESVDDLANIKSIAFAENQVLMEAESQMGKIALKYDTAGVKTAKLCVEDENGNVTEKEFTVNVIEDYLAHVSGFKDITLEQGSAVNWLEGIIQDEKIAGITVDESGVDVNTPGEYILKYLIQGDDAKTVIEQSVRVVVTAPEPETVVTASTSSSSSSGNRNSGSSNHSSGSASSSGSSSGSSSSGGSSSGNSLSGAYSENGSDWLNSLEPGDTWTSEDEGSGYIDGPDGNIGVSGTW